MIGIVGCGKAKLTRPARAKDLYTGTLFCAQYRYAKARCHTVFILSAKYGLVRDTEMLRPYDVTVSNFSAEQKNEWCKLVAGQLQTVGAGKILALVSAPYEQALEPRAADVVNPLRGLPLGKRCQFLTRSSVQ